PCPPPAPPGASPDRRAPTGDARPRRRPAADPRARQRAVPPDRRPARPCAQACRCQVVEALGGKEPATSRAKRPPPARCAPTPCEACRPPPATNPPAATRRLPRRAPHALPTGTPIALPSHWTGANQEPGAPMDHYNFERFRAWHLFSDAKATLAARGIRPGELAPDFELQRVDGGTLRLSDLRGG